MGELRTYPDAAIAVLSDLTGHRLVAFDRITTGSAAHDLDGLQAEWAPPPADHTGDHGGFDIAAAVRTADDRSLLLTVEVKYTDDFSRAPLDPAGYRAGLDRLGIGRERAGQLVAGKASQFLRSVLLTDSVRHGGRSPERAVDEVLAVVLCRDDDAAARRVVDLVGNAQSAVSVALWGLGAALDVMARQEALTDWADAVRARYVIDDPAPA